MSLIKITNQLIEEYRTKSYEELLALPEHFLLDLPELMPLQQTVEFIRVKGKKKSLKIVFRHAHWKVVPQNKNREKYIEQFISAGLSKERAEIKADNIIKKSSNAPQYDKESHQLFVELYPEASFPLPKIEGLALIHASFGDHFFKFPDNTSKSIDEITSELMEKENKKRERAKWFGKTGLDDETERELPRYLRREFGEILGDDGALKASDLAYLGHFELTEADYQNKDANLHESIVSIHVWKIADSDNYAYVEITDDGVCALSMGDYLPEKAR